jgi:hypothetical protein
MDYVGDLDCVSCDYIYNSRVCRTNCNGDFIIKICFGCGQYNEITQDYTVYDIDYWRNYLIGCSADLCFCDEDVECTGMASGYEETSKGNCS